MIYTAGDTFIEHVGTLMLIVHIQSILLTVLLTPADTVSGVVGGRTTLAWWQTGIKWVACLTVKEVVGFVHTLSIRHKILVAAAVGDSSIHDTPREIVVKDVGDIADFCYILEGCGFTAVAVGGTVSCCPFG